MDYTISWFREGRILHVWTRGNVRLSEISEVSQTLRAYLDQAQPTVHLLCDISELGNVPTNMYALRNATIPYLKHPRTGWQVVYGSQSSALRSMASALAKLTNSYIGFVASLDDALAFLRGKDPGAREILS